MSGSHAADRPADRRPDPPTTRPTDRPPNRPPAAHVRIEVRGASSVPYARVARGVRAGGMRRRHGPGLRAPPQYEADISWPALGPAVERIALGGEPHASRIPPNRHGRRQFTVQPTLCLPSLAHIWQLASGRCGGRCPARRPEGQVEGQGFRLLRGRRILRDSRRPQPMCGWNAFRAKVVARAGFPG